MIKFLRKLSHLNRWRKRGYPVSPYKILKTLNKSQYWSEDRIQSYQLDKINKILSFAKENSEFYKNNYRDTIFPVENLYDYKTKFPHIAKIDIVDNYENFKTNRFSNKVKCSSSGSTGEPLVLFTSSLNESYRKAGQLRFYNWWGIKQYDKSVLFWRTMDEPNNSLISKIKKSLLGKYKIDVHNLDEKNIEEHFDYIEKFKPRYIRGYKSSILEFAELMKDKNLTFKNLNLKVIIVTAENLYEYERIIIEEVFKCKVANEYGASELGFLGFECPQGKMHIYEEASYIFSDENNAAYITDFFNDSMPLINYKNDDCIEISLDKCNCGRSGRIINQVIGREQGYVIRPDGTKINQFILMIIFGELYTKRLKVVKRFKIYQKNNFFRVEVVPLKNFDSSCKDFIIKRMKEEIDEDIEIKFEMVDKIDRDKSGKLNFFVREK
jgi:phenylacetate-CoA ligase